jgi:anoctamin-10
VRSDAAKICTSRRRPIPHRADSIGPWLDNLSFIAWLGTLTNCTLIYLFGADDAVFQFDYSSIICLLVIVLIAEHIYWIVDYVVGSASKQYKTDGEVIVTKEDYVLRQRQLRDSSGDNHSGTEGHDDNSYRARGFWKGKGVEESVRDGFELLSKGGHRSRGT